MARSIAESYWGPGSGSSGFFTGADNLTSSPFDSGYWSSIASKYGNTQSNQGNVARIGPDGLAYTGGTTSRYTGKDPISGKTYKDGVEQTLVPGTSDQYINPNDPNARYAPVSIAKNPALNAVTDAQTEQLAKSVAGNIKSWSDLLPDYNAAGAASIASSKTAADTSGAQKTFQDAQNRFSTGLDTAQGDYATLDAANAAKQRDIVARRYADEAAYNDLQNQSRDVAQAGVMRMTSKNGALRGGIPFGTDAQAAFARQSYEASLPYQLAKEQYHQQNLANESGVETALTADEARRIGFNVSAQGQQYQSAQGTAQAIQALKVASASQDQETVKRILQNPQLLQEAVRQSMQGDAQLGLLITQAIGANNYQALTDKLGIQVSQPQYFSAGPTGGYPAATTPTGGSPSYWPNSGTSTGTGGGNGGTPALTLDATGGIKPGTYNPYGNPAMTNPNRYQDNGDGTYTDTFTGLPYQSGQAISNPRYGSPNVNNAQAGYTYNPATGKLEDASGNWYNPG